MHSKYLGTDMVFLASCLWLLCYRILPDSPLQNLKACWDKVLEVRKKKKKYTTGTEAGTNWVFLSEKRVGLNSKVEQLKSQL